MNLLLINKRNIVKGAVITFAILFPSITFYLGIKYQESKLSVLDSPTITPSPKYSQEVQQKPCNFGLVMKDNYLDKYTVQKGDSLTSIAEKQLDNSNRVNQLIALNQQENPSLKSSTSLIEMGWKLYIPSKELLNLTGNLTAVDGKLVKKNDLTWSILLGEGSIPQEYIIDQNTTLLDKKDFNVSDCIRIIESGIYPSDGRYTIVQKAIKHQK